MRRYVLDACAVITVLNGEPGADVVMELLRAADADIVINKLNLLEVYYDVLRRCDRKTAKDVVEETKVAGVRVVSELTNAVFTEAGRLKASYKISLADAVALAEAMVSGASLVTSDHHEFDLVAEQEDISFLWIR